MNASFHYIKIIKCMKWSTACNCIVSCLFQASLLLLCFVLKYLTSVSVEILLLDEELKSRWVDETSHALQECRRVIFCSFDFRYSHGHETNISQRTKHFYFLWLTGPHSLSIVFVSAFKERGDNNLLYCYGYYY